MALKRIMSFYFIVAQVTLVTRKKYNEYLLLNCILNVILQLNVKKTYFANSNLVNFTYYLQN